MPARAGIPPSSPSKNVKYMPLINITPWLAGRFVSGGIGMVTVYDVNPNDLIERAAVKLREAGLKEPEWVHFVKSGSDKERIPDRKDFWYVRCASLLRQAYVKNVVGVSRLRTHYGGRKKRGVRKGRKKDAGGSIIRKGLQELERIGFIKKEKVGRGITKKGMAFLDGVANEVKKGK
jgi:small subunit ribosomal protein S19e